MNPVNKEQSIEILDAARRVKLLVIGDVMLDRYHWGRVNRISPEAPVPVVDLIETSTAAGGAANVAANVTGLGAEAVLIGITGEDAESDVLVEALSIAGLGTDGIIRLADRPTTVKTRVVAHGQHIVRIDSERKSPIPSSAEDVLMAMFDRLVPAAGAVIVSDYAKGLLTPRLLSHLIMNCRETGRPVIVDPKGKDFSKYAGATIITPNGNEAIEASQPGLGFDAIGPALLQSHGLEAVLITQGEAGMSLYRSDGRVDRFSARARQVFDVTGAGDTVVASLATALAADRGLTEAVGFANLAAGIVVEHVGTTVIDAGMIGKYFSDHSQAQ